jgi:hypothetical protein
MNQQKFIYSTRREDQILEITKLPETVAMQWQETLSVIHMAGARISQLEQNVQRAVDSAAHLAAICEIIDYHAGQQDLVTQAALVRTSSKTAKANPFTVLNSEIHGLRNWVMETTRDLVWNILIVQQSLEENILILKRVMAEMESGTVSVPLEVSQALNEVFNTVHQVGGRLEALHESLRRSDYGQFYPDLVKTTSLH